MVKSKINSLFFNTLAPTRLLAIAASDCLKIIHFSSIAIQTSQIYIDAQIKKPPSLFKLGCFFWFEILFYKEVRSMQVYEF